MRRIVLLSSCLALTMLSSNAIAQDRAQTSEQALQQDARAYAATYKVSEDEAARRILIMAGDEEQVQAAIAATGEDFAGAYFDNGPDFALVVRTTARNAPATRTLTAKPARGNGGGNASEGGLVDRLRASASAPVRYSPGAANSLKTLRNKLSSNNQLFRDFAAQIELTAIDEETGDIVLQIVERDAARRNDIESRRAQLERILGAPIRLEFFDNPIQKVGAVGGTPLTWGGTSDPQCTVAFGAISPTSDGLLTAGHCVDSSWSGGYDYVDPQTGTRYRLKYQLLYNQDDADMLFWQATGLAATNKFAANKGEAWRTVTGRRTLGTTETRGGTATGSFVAGTSTVKGSVVCFYGRTTGPQYGQSCGEVTYKGIRCNCSGSNCSGYMVQIEGAMTCTGGDSGAPVFAYQTAFGVLNGCDPNSGAQGATRRASYTSLDFAYSYGYSLKY